MVAISNETINKALYLFKKETKKQDLTNYHNMDILYKFKPSGPIKSFNKKYIFSDHQGYGHLTVQCTYTLDIEIDGNEYIGLINFKTHGCVKCKMIKFKSINNYIKQNINNLTFTSFKKI